MASVINHRQQQQQQQHRCEPCQ